MGRFQTNMNQIKSDVTAFESGGGGNTNWFKMVDGKQLVRVLPPWSESGLFYKKVGYHRPPGRKTDKVVCPDYTFGTKGECPICKARAKAFKDLGKDAAKHYNIQKRALVNVLDMKKGDGVVYVLDAPATVMNPILNTMAEADSDQLIDPEKGFNVLVKRKNEGGFTKYDVVVMPGEFSLSKKGYDVDEILENLYDLDAFISEPDPDDFTEILEAINVAAYGDGTDDEKEVGIDDEDDDDVAPAKAAKPTGKTLKSKKVVDDEEEEDDEPVAPVAKKKPAPAPVAAKSKKAVEVEEDDAEEDEDEIPAPKAKSKQVSNGSAKKAKPHIDDEDDDEIDTDLSGVDDFEGFDESEEIPF